MSDLLHIVNGDSTAQCLNDSSLEGDILVWREMLCEGPIHPDIDSDVFWTQRYAYFENTYHIPRLEYFDKTIKEVLKIQDIHQYKEVVLWFEYDLFCQINLMAVLNYLLGYFMKSVNYRLICVGGKRKDGTHHTLAHYKPDEYPKLYERKQKLARPDLMFAQKFWSVYCANQPEELMAFPYGESKKFNYLKPAIEQHLKRAKQFNRLNQQELQILNIINELQPTKSALIKALLIWQEKETLYGFGDLQYARMIDDLKQFYTTNDDVYTLNQDAKQWLA